MSAYLDWVAKGPASADELIERMVARREITEAGYETPCWLSLYSTSRDGYAQIGVARTMLYIHRLFYELTVASLPDERQVDHLCRVRHCFNPDHMEPVTLAENVRRSSRIAEQIARTHCPQGHPYDAHNTIRRGGKRDCRACQNARRTARHQAKKGAA